MMYAAWWWDTMQRIRSTMRRRRSRTASRRWCRWWCWWYLWEIEHLERNFFFSFHIFYCLMNLIFYEFCSQLCAFITNTLFSMSSWNKETKRNWKLVSSFGILKCIPFLLRLITLILLSKDFFSFLLLLGIIAVKELLRFFDGILGFCIIFS